jgi:2-oxoglutarate dehydrogenase E2 component (dihydrolipoamide succinyltransferase)
MARVEIRLPKMGESVTEATITNWLKEVGDVVEMDEPLVEVATDKVDNELPSEAEGTVVEILFGKDDVVQVGDTIAVIETEGGSVAVEPAKEVAAATKVDATIINEVKASVSNSIEETSISKNGPSGKFYSPLVRNIAKTEGVSMEQLETISGSGQGGRVTKKDILAFIENKPVITASSTPVKDPKVAAVSSPSPVAPKTHKVNIPSMEGDEIIEMDRMRKMIADHMVMSKDVSPHVTSYVEADVTNIFKWRAKVKDEFMNRENEKITFTPIFMEAIVKAIKDFPMINVCVDGDKIIKRKSINIGMATALPSGNLIVPVIKKADQLNLIGITKSVNDLANRAINNKLVPDDTQGGTYTVTNVGTFGNVMGTPIINQPQVAILALGAIRKVPAVIETPDGDFIGIRYKMFLSHSYDHRVVDGALGGMFVKRVADYLEQFDPNREF